MKVSNCCGVEPVCYNGPGGTPDSDSMDHSICPECKDGCDYIEEEEFYNENGIPFDDTLSNNNISPGNIL